MKLLQSLRESAAPAVAVAFTSRQVSAAALDVRGGQPVVAAHAEEPLPGGALVPSLTNANVVDRGAVATALGRVFDRLGSRPRRVGVVVPDSIAKVSLVRFEHVPTRAQDLDQLVRWQVRKAAPFAIEDAQVSYVPGVRSPEGQEFVVSLARRSVIQEYETLCRDEGAHAGLVDLATFNIVNAVLAAGTPPLADWLLVHVAPDYASLAIVRGEDLVFFRNRTADGEGTVADLVHQTAMYYEDRLKGAGFARALLAGATSLQASEDVEAVRRTLEDRLALNVETVDPRAAAGITDRIAAAPALLDALAPLVGMLMRDRTVAKAG
ncbi:MAG: type IV pilus biogenesis protein PilM [Betaproteobacteria bacterium]